VEGNGGKVGAVTLTAVTGGPPLSGAAVAVPSRSIDCGESEALSVTTSFDSRRPETDGAITTSIVHVLPFSTGCPRWHVPPTILNCDDDNGPTVVVDKPLSGRAS
jgi:hypothetical protein